MTNKLVDWLLGDPERFSSDARLINLGITVAFVGIYSAATFNLLLGFSFADTWPIFASGLPLGLVAYFNCVKQWPDAAIFTLLLTISLALGCSWLLKGGLFGNTPIYFLIIPLQIFVFPGCGAI